MDELKLIQQFERDLENARSQADQLRGQIKALEDELEAAAGAKEPKKVAAVLKRLEKQRDQLHEQLAETLNALEEIVNGGGE